MCADKYCTITITTKSFDLAKPPYLVSDIYFGTIKGLTVAMTQEQSKSLSLFIENINKILSNYLFKTKCASTTGPKLSLANMTEESKHKTFESLLFFSSSRNYSFGS